MQKPNLQNRKKTPTHKPRRNRAARTTSNMPCPAAPYLAHRASESRAAYANATSRPQKRTREAGQASRPKEHGHKQLTDLGSPVEPGHTVARGLRSRRRSVSPHASTQCKCPQRDQKSYSTVGGGAPGTVRSIHMQPAERGGAIHAARAATRRWESSRRASGSMRQSKAKANGQKTAMQQTAKRRRSSGGGGGGGGCGTQSRVGARRAVGFTAPSTSADA